VQEASAFAGAHHVDEAEIGRAAAEEMEIIRRSWRGIGAHAVKRFTDLGEEEQDHVGEILRSDIVPERHQAVEVDTIHHRGSRQVGGDPWP
jgi:hypothetical protein